MGEIPIVPGKFAGFNDHAGNRIAMSIDKLGRLMNYDIRAMLKRAAEIGGRKGIIDH